jgi:hypothetical protein
MDRANAELAEYLCTTDAIVHLVSFRVDPELAARSNVYVHQARRVAGANFLAQGRLDRLGRSVAAKVAADAPDTRVIVNGVNCAWPDINWVHFVHREWSSRAAFASLVFSWLRTHRHAFDYVVVQGYGLAALVAANLARRLSRESPLPQTRIDGDKGDGASQHAPRITLHGA